MSSVQSAFAQVGPREKYFISTLAAGVTALIPAGSSIESTVGLEAFELVRQAGTVAATGVLYFDLGRSVTVYDDATRLAVLKYQKVAVVNGPNTEGNDADAAAAGDLYVLVWAADNTVKVGVARTG
jgi:hypothetical protein